MLELEPSRLGPQLEDRQPGRVVHPDRRLGQFAHDIRELRVLLAAEQSLAELVRVDLPAAAKLNYKPTDRAGRVKVSQDLSLPEHPEVFVIGDLADIKDKAGKPVPGVAPAAIQQGKAAAKNVWRSIQGKTREPFEYWDKGSLATIGRGAGIAEIGRLHLSGLVAWIAWLTVHIFFLIGFRNRMTVFIQWAWAYFTSQSGARLITGATDLPEETASRSVRP